MRRQTSYGLGDTRSSVAVAATAPCDLAAATQCLNKCDLPIPAGPVTVTRPPRRDCNPARQLSSRPSSASRPTIAPDAPIAAAVVPCSLSLLSDSMPGRFKKLSQSPRSHQRVAQVLQLVTAAPASLEYREAMCARNRDYPNLSSRLLDWTLAIAVSAPCTCNVCGAKVPSRLCSGMRFIFAIRRRLHVSFFGAPPQFGRRAQVLSRGSAEARAARHGVQLHAPASPPPRGAPEGAAARCSSHRGPPSPARRLPPAPAAAARFVFERTVLSAPGTRRSRRRRGGPARSR